MAPTLKNGESAIVAMAFDPPVRRDIVAFRSPHDESKNFVLRIIALPGERIEMTDGRVEYFVLGDNRRHSFDSRSFGTVGRSSIYAKVLTP